jgi:hypothetical protein
MVASTEMGACDVEESLKGGGGERKLAAFRRMGAAPILLFVVEEPTLVPL